MKKIILHWVLIVILVAIFACFVGIEIYIYQKYANVPVAELPSWVFFFMFGGKK